MNLKIGNTLVLDLSHGDTNGISETNSQTAFSWTLKMGASRVLWIVMGSTWNLSLTRTLCFKRWFLKGLFLEPFLIRKPSVTGFCIEPLRVPPKRQTKEHLWSVSLTFIDF